MTLCFAVPDTSEDRVARHAAEIEKSLNEISSDNSEETGRVIDQAAADQRSRLSENIRAQLVSISPCYR